ncbi:MAG: DUF3726 domain-containing protein, partial [Pseudomonadota bacterium]
IQSTCTKAARGAGFSWGMAEDAGLAVRNLEAHGLPGAQALASLLDSPYAKARDRTGVPGCGLAALVDLSDAPPVVAGQFGPMAAPLLLVAPCLMMAQTGCGWRVEWRGGAAHCSVSGVKVTGQPAPLVADWVSVARTATPEASATAPDWRSRDIPPDTWSLLEALAARTYVPDSDTSRALGAGPGAADAD